MRLDIGKTYRNGWGNTHTIMGHVRHDQTLVWSLLAKPSRGSGEAEPRSGSTRATQQGNHYRQADGRYAPLGTPQDL